MPRLATGLAAGVILAACQTTAAVALRPAVLVDATPEALRQLDRTLAAATGRGRIKRGPGDVTKEPAIAVLPPPPGPYEGNSPAMPVYFDLVTDGKGCFVRDRSSGKTHVLRGVSCRPK